MATKFYLPEKQGRQEALVRAIDGAEKHRRRGAVDWFVVYHYLQGCRYFSSMDYQQGTVVPSYQNQHGGMPFRLEECVNKRDTEIGRLLRLDTSPSVQRQGTGLDGLRKESTAQAILDAVAPFIMPEEKKRIIMELLTDYGACGLLVDRLPKEERDPLNPAASLDMEVLPPWELLIFPASARGPADRNGLGRTRMVSLEWLRTQKIGDADLSKLKDTDELLEVKKTMAGETLTDHADGSSSFGSSHLPAANTYTKLETGSRGGKKAEQQQSWVRLVEVWREYPNGRLRSYDLMAGRKLLHTKQYKNRQATPMMPISVAIRGEGVGPYGRSFISRMITLNQEIEGAFQNLFRNLRDFDIYGKIGIPASWGLTESDMQAIGPGNSRYFILNRDPTIPNDRIEQVQPANSGKFAADVGHIGLELLDRAAQQPEMITDGSAPGRVDSTPALNFLYQTSTLPLGGIASCVASAFATAYKAVLGFASGWDNIQLNFSTLTDDAVIGLVFDSETGAIELGKNRVPDPAQLTIGISSQEPEDPQSKKEELHVLLDKQLISPSQFRIKMRIEKLDAVLPHDSEWENYRTAIIRNLLLFNDGKTPGELQQNMGISDYDNPEIHLMVINRLMSSPEFMLASAEVQEGFRTLIDEFQDRMGSPLPEGMGNPEDEAEMMAQMEQGMPPGGPGDNEMPPEMMGPGGMPPEMQPGMVPGAPAGGSEGILSALSPDQ